MNSSRNKFIVITVLAISLIITAYVSLSIKTNIEKITEQDFNFHSNEILNIVSDRLDDYAHILQSGVALFNASQKVTREEWKVFNETQKIEQHLPGIQGFGFSLLIPPSELARHTQKIREEGFPLYKLWPKSDQNIYTSIIYLEPFSGRNLRAFGYDMFSEPVRRAAMEQARDTGAAAISGKVVLVQENDTDPQAGTLMYAPVYRKGLPLNTVEQRRAAIYGWVYSPYRMTDLIKGILGEHLEKEKDKKLQIQIFDGQQASFQNLLYQSDPSDKIFPHLMPLEFNNHHWILGVSKTHGGLFTMNYFDAWITLVSGLLLTILLTILIHTLLNSQSKAREIAKELIIGMRETEKRYQNLLESVPAIIYNFSIKHGGVFYSPQVEQVFGYPLQAFYDDPLLWKNSIHPDDANIVKNAIEKVTVAGESSFDIEYRIRTQSGEWLWLRDCSIRHETLNNDVVIFGIAQNITTLKTQSETLRELAEALSTAEESERRRIAKILHDDIQQLLAAARFQLSLCNKGTPSEMTGAKNKIDELLSQCLDITRSLSVDLNPPVLRDADLKSALLWLGEWMHEKHDLTVDLTCNIPTQFSEDIRVLLFQSIRELLFNTVKHSQTKNARVNISVVDDQLEVLVTDNGVGFDPSQTKSKGGLSWGLGLVGVRERIFSFGGRTIVKTAPGEGCQFKILLPVSKLKISENNLAESKTKTPKTSNAATNKTEAIRIIIADDHAVMRESLSQLFIGIEDIKIIGEACDGEEAVELAKKLQPDVILMDMSMPIMNGLEATKILAAELPLIKIIGLSMYDEAEAGRNMRKAGAANFLTKTGEPSILIAAIRECCTIRATLG